MRFRKSYFLLYARMADNIDTLDRILHNADLPLDALRALGVLAEDMRAAQLDAEEVYACAKPQKRVARCQRFQGAKKGAFSTCKKAPSRPPAIHPEKRA